jgi:zinc/manganese transport system permease protein
MIGIAFLALVGVAAGEATQAVGALLLLGLLATPAACAQRLTTQPFLGMWISSAIAVASIWIGLGIAYAASSIPPSFAILAVATGTYVIVLISTTVFRRRASQRATNNALHSQDA